MDSLKMYLAVWLSGLAVGMVLMERWRRTGGLSVAAADDFGQAVGTGTASAPMEAPADQPPVSAVILAGAKADAQRARQLLDRVMPWGSTSGPSFAQLHRAGRATAPGTTPDRPT